MEGIKDKQYIISKLQKKICRKERERVIKGKQEEIGWK